MTLEFVNRNTASVVLAGESSASVVLSAPDVASVVLTGFNAGPLVLKGIPEHELRVQLYPFFQGPPGNGGSGAPSYDQVYASASSWVINHNLGFRPSVKALTVGGVEMWVEVIHVSLNQAIVYFDTPTAGRVICS